MRNFYSERGIGEQNYEFFHISRERSDIFEFSKGIAEYLHTQHINDLVLLDKSARIFYMGIREYWQSNYPNEKIPNIYFINPHGFKSRDALSDSEVEYIERKYGFSIDVYAMREDNESVLREFTTTYKQLISHKDLPVLIFDTCVHSGFSLNIIVESFQKVGFSKLRIGSVNPSDSESVIKTDFHITKRPPVWKCCPFWSDKMITKNFDHVYSQAETNPRFIAQSSRLRYEIKRIVLEQLSKQNMLHLSPETTISSSEKVLWDQKSSTIKPPEMCSDEMILQIF